MRKLCFAIAILGLILSGCGKLRYSQLTPETKDFHPQRIAVLPVDVGPYAEATGVIDQVIAGVLVDKGWFTDVVAADRINKQLQSNEELKTLVTDYLAKLRTVNFSDPALSAKIGELCRVDAFLVVTVDYWNYTRENEENLAKVGAGIKMVEAGTGDIAWKATHYLPENYRIFKPELPDVARSLFKKMLRYMPH
ncbi:MAG: hypothetical protein WC560_03405 [Syntrophales bacterium]